MEAGENGVKLYYNTEKEKLKMPEYGRNILTMIEQLRTIEDRDKRNRQAQAIVKSMEILNPQVHQQDNFDHKLWDHLFLIAGFDLDVDSPYPKPVEEDLNCKPQVIDIKKKPIKAYHYGRNIESIINLICQQPEGEVKDAMIKSIATYMRQQYLIWNKDSVADRTIFDDIEKLSGGRLTVPEGISLSKIAQSASFSRPVMTLNVGGTQQNQQSRNWGTRKNRRPNNRKK